MKPSELRAFWDELASEAGLSEEETQAVGSVFSDESKAKVFLDKFVPKSEYSSALDTKTKEIKAAQDRYGEATAKIGEYDEWAKKVALPAAERLEKREKLLAAQVKAYEELYGALDPDTKPAPAPDDGNKGTVLTQEDLQRALTQALNLNTTLMDLALDYQFRYGKKFDLPKFRAFAEGKAEEAQKNGHSFDLPSAYREFTHEEYQALQEKETQEKIDKEVQKKEEEFKQQYSQTHVPIQDRPTEDGMRVDIRPDAKPEKELTETERMKSFTDAWYEEGTKQAGAE